MTTEMTIDDLWEKIENLSNANTSQLKEEIQNIKKQFEENVKELELRTNQIKKLTIQHERKNRKNNIIIFGLNIDEEHLLDETLLNLNRLLNIELHDYDINNIYFVGKKNTFWLNLYRS